ncbi:hypothetical protein BGZ51_005831 [Haplosporangium sp. Z 767]|nr:hypothetical protein BGZ51_005831 [Haplosporangium sp. Z 767]KAF9194600.1 hypothetical protein BGZ50_006113 [Haplosporangium sp. Z 11]
MFRALTKSSTAVAALAQRQTFRQTQMFAATSTAAFHSSSVQNNNNNDTSDIFAALYSNSSKSSKAPVDFFGSAGRTGGKSLADMPMFGFSSAKANTTANPIHLEATHPTEGRSFRVNSASTVDQTYRRLRNVINQSNIKRELRLRRTYENGHTRMRRENQERNKKLFGNMVRKKIQLINLMKLRGM